MGVECLGRELEIDVLGDAFWTKDFKGFFREGIGFTCEHLEICCYAHMQIYMDIDV
jgi:hypothetical protein